MEHNTLANLPGVGDAVKGIQSCVTNAAANNPDIEALVNSRRAGLDASRGRAENAFGQFAARSGHGAPAIGAAQPASLPTRAPNVPDARTPAANGPIRG
jgi:hypothetical protein